VVREVFVAGTTMPQRSLPKQQAAGEYHRYRVRARVQVVRCVARPAHGEVGGGHAFVLPRPVAELVAEGGFVEV
jgi:hypothetical protein